MGFPAASVAAGNFMLSFNAGKACMKLPGKRRALYKFLKNMDQ